MTKADSTALEPRYLLVKRGLYYRPNSCGYTGFKEHAGRYLESDASPRSGVTAIHEDEASEIAPNCFDDRDHAYLNDKLAKAATLLQSQAATIAELEGVLEAILRGDVPRPVGKHWRADCKPTKHDRCIHDVWMHETCGDCLDAFVEAALTKSRSAG